MERKLFNNIDAKKFNAIVKWFRTNKDKARSHLMDSCAYAAGAVYASGDITHANKIADAVEAFGFGPMFRRCVVPLIPYKYNRKDLCFEGKIQKGKRARLEELNEDGIPYWEAMMFAKFNEESEPKQTKEKTHDDYIKSIAKAAKVGFQHGLTAEEIRNAVTAAILEAQPPVDKAA